MLKHQHPNQVTTTGRSTDAEASSEQTPTPPVQPGSDPARPVNPDEHGTSGQTQPTEASRLEDEAATSEENRY